MKKRLQNIVSAVDKYAEIDISTISLDKTKSLDAKLTVNLAPRGTAGRNDRRFDVPLKVEVSVRRDGHRTNVILCEGSWQGKYIHIVEPLESLPPQDRDELEGSDAWHSILNAKQDAEVKNNVTKGTYTKPMGCYQTTKLFGYEGERTVVLPAKQVKKLVPVCRNPTYLYAAKSKCVWEQMLKGVAQFDGNKMFTKVGPGLMYLYLSMINQGKQHIDHAAETSDERVNCWYYALYVFNQIKTECDVSSQSWYKFNTIVGGRVMQGMNYLTGNDWYHASSIREKCDTPLNVVDTEEPIIPEDIQQLASTIVEQQTPVPKADESEELSEEDMNQIRST